MKKLFTLLTLTLLSIGTAWAADQKVGRTLEFSSTPTTYTLTGYKVGNDDIIKVTMDDGTGMSIQTGKGLYYKTTSATTINASCYQANNTTAYSSDKYAGMKLEIADGYAITVTNIKARIAAGNNFTYRILVTDGTNAIYTSQNKTISNYNKENASNLDATLSGLDPTLILSGTVYVRIQYYCNAKTKYIAPLELSVTGAVSNTLTTYAISTATSPNAGGTITGGGTYFAGQKVFLKAVENPGYAFVKWQKDGSDFDGNTEENITVLASAAASYTAIYSATTSYTINGEITAGQSSYGSITNEGENIVNENDNITFVATANEGYAFVKWQKDGADFSGNTTVSITVTSTADATYTAIFKKLFTVTYDIDDYNNTTTKALNNYNATYSINEKYAAANDKYTIPSYSHYYMYREGYIFSKWKDQDDNEYNKGTEITLTKDITLTPVWVATTQTLANSTSENTVTWNFGKSTILFNGWQNAPQVGYYTIPLTVNGELIAVPMIVNATSGKVDNSSRTDALAQVNGGTTFTIPAIKGMTVELTASNNITNTTVAGNTPSSGSGTKTATYNYTGENGTAVIDIKDGSYYEKIVVTYPQTTIAATISEYGKSTFSSSHPVDIANATPAGLKAYKATAATASSVTMVEVTDAVAGMTGYNKTGLVLVGTPSTTYYIPIAASGTEPEGNLLFGCDGSWDEVTVADNGTNFVLSVQNDEVVWAPVKSDVAPISEGQAALWANVTINQSRSLRMTFGDNSVTGISEVAKVAEKEGKFFEDGKLVIVKNGKKFNAKGQLVK